MMITNRFGNSFLFVCFSLIVAAVTALALVRQESPKLNNLAEGDLKDLVIKFERTGCYGNCPAYKLIIYGDGRVEYEGGTNVKVSGKKEGRLKPDEVKSIVSAFDKVNFFAMESYSEEHCSCTICTDMPTVFTDIRVAGNSHRVDHYHGCRCAPKELWELENSIDSIAGTKQWTGDVSKSGPFGTTCFNK
jgi:hypothetical protein